MGVPVVIVSSGGIPVTQVTGGTPMTVADNGFGMAVTMVASGGIPVSGLSAILLSGFLIAEGAAAGTAIGTLSVTGVTGSPTFTLVDASNRTALSGGTAIQAGATATDYEAAQSFNIVVQVSGVTPAIADTTFQIIVTNVIEDTTPASFSFTDVTSAALSSVYTSNAITVSGVDGACDVTVTGGTYSINGGAYTSAAGSCVSGDTITVRGTASGSYSTGVDVVLSVGGNVTSATTDTFTITTLADPAAVPDAPSLAWTSDNTDSTPDFDATLPTGLSPSTRNAAAGDVLRIEYSPGNTYVTRTLISSDLLGSAISLSASAIAESPTAYPFRARLERSGSGNSAWSADCAVTISAGTGTSVLLLSDGTSKLLLSNGTDHLLLETTATSTLLLSDGTSKLLLSNGTDRLRLAA